MSITTAVIGCGAISRVHIKALLCDPRFELTALVDPDTTALEQTRLKWQIAPALCRHTRELEDVEAAIVAVPPGLHAEVVSALLHRGIHVLCEKPMGTNAAEAVGMIDVAKRHRVVLAVGFMRRFSPNTQLLKGALAGDYIGDIREFRLVDGTRTDWDSANPRRFDPVCVPGGVMFESGIHWIDRLIYWFGDPEVVEFQDDRLGGVEANAYVEADYRRAGRTIRGSVRLSWTEKWGSALEVTGTEGRLILNDKHPEALTLVRRLGRHERRLLLRTEDANAPDLFQCQLDSFWRAIETPDCGVLAMGEDSRRALQFIEDAYKVRTDMRQPWVFSGLLKHLVREEAESPVTGRPWGAE